MSEKKNRWYATESLSDIIHMDDLPERVVLDIETHMSVPSIVFIWDANHNYDLRYVKMVPNKSWLIDIASDLIAVVNKQKELSNSLQDMYSNWHIAKSEL